MSSAYFYFAKFIYQGCGVGRPWSPFFGLESEWESFIWSRLRLRVLFVSFGLLYILLQFIWLLCNLFTIKTLYIIVYLLLEKIKISANSSLSTQTVCHTISPRVGVGVKV